MGCVYGPWPSWRLGLSLGVDIVSFNRLLASPPFCAKQFRSLRFWEHHSVGTLTGVAWCFGQAILHYPQSPVFDLPVL